MGQKGKMLIELPINDSRQFFSRAAGRSPLSKFAGDITLSEQNIGQTVTSTGAGASTTTIPLNTGQFNVGDTILLLRYGAGSLTVVATGGVTIRTAGGAPLTISQQYGQAALQNLGGDEWLLSGSLG